MLGQFSTSGISDLNSRIFVYEVAGLSQNDVTTLSQVPIRNSHNQFFQVPLSRMNHEMQRILSLGGKIVNVRPLNSQQAAIASEASSPAKASEE